MKVSTKGQYALKVMVALMNYEPNAFVSLKELSEVCNVTVKYLEQIIPLLKNSGLLRSLRGKDGGYCLSRRPAEYNLLEIVTAAEGSLAPVAALEQTETAAQPSSGCDNILYIWSGLYETVKGYLAGISLQDVKEKINGIDGYVYYI